MSLAEQTAGAVYQLENKMKKAQGLSLNVIIIAVILIVVLIVLVVIFTGKIGIFSKTTATCASKGGQCSETFGQITCPEGYATVPGKTDCENTCCIPVE